MKSRVSENRPCPGPSEVGSQQSMGGSEVTFLPPEGVYCQVGTCPIKLLPDSFTWNAGFLL